MDQERESYGTEVERLCGDLEVTRIESANEETKKVCCFTNVHYLRHGLSAIVAPCRERH